MIVAARRRQARASSSVCSTCTSTSDPRASDISCVASFSPTWVPSQRLILRSARRFVIPLVPPAWSPVAHVSSQAALRDFCLPRQEPLAPTNVLNRSPLGSCSPSFAKFSRTSVGQRVSISTSTTTLPASINAATFHHPTMTYLTVNGIKAQPHRHHHLHHYRCRHRR